MSFSHPKRPAYGSLRHSRSSSTLAGLSRARHSRNCFQRSPLRTSYSTQCLFPSTSTTAKEEAEEEEEQATSTHFSAVSTSTYLRVHDASSSDSEYSEYDLVNEQMQGFLLDSDDSCGEAESGDGVLGMVAYSVSGYMPFEPAEGHNVHLHRRTAVPQHRRRLAKKSESSASLTSAARMTPSSSTTLLADLEVNMREVMVAAVGPSQLRSRRQRRTAASDKRWLLPPAAPLFAGSTGHQSTSPLFTVVFDLDETLVSARHGPILLRPHVGELLRTLHTMPVEVVVWTAGTAHYVNPILHALGEACGRRQWFHHIISRHKRWYTGANGSVKDLSLLGRPLDRVVMVENNPISVVPQPASCILVEDYLQANAADDTLRVLQGVLQRLLAAHGKKGEKAVASAAAHGACAGPRDEHVDDSLSEARRTAASLPSLSQLLSGDEALRSVEFRVEDLCNEDGVSMHQRVELHERLAGAEVILCRALRYSPSYQTTRASAETPVSVSLRSYGCVNPLFAP